jgi:hypothetical protein
MKNLLFPKSNKEEIILTLIQQAHVSIFDFPYLSGYRTRISEIINEHGLKLTRKISRRCNKFGNSYSYAIYYLEKSEKENAIALYKKLTTNQYEKRMCLN